MSENEKGAFGKAWENHSEDPGEKAEKGNGMTGQPTKRDEQTSGKERTSARQADAT